MKNRDPRLRVGIVLVAFTALLFLLVFSLDGTLSWLRGTRSLEAEFHEVKGIRVSDPVRFQGVPCGRVANIRFEDGGEAPSSMDIAHAESRDAPPDARGVAVILTLDIPDEIYGYLRSGSRARIEKTLTGVTVVNILQGTGKPLDPGARIPGELRPGVDEVAAAMDRAGRKLTSILDDVSDMMDGLQKDQVIPDMLRALERASVDGSDVVARLRGFLEDREKQLRSITAHAASLCERLDEASRDLPAVVADLGTMARRGERTAGEIGDWVRANRPRLDAIAEDLAKGSHNVRTLTAEIRRRPWRLLHSPSRKEAQELDLYETASAYSEGALELRRTVDELAALLRDPPAGSDVVNTLSKTLTEVEARVSRHRAFEQQLWKRLQQIER